MPLGLHNTHSWTQASLAESKGAQNPANIARFWRKVAMAGTDACWLWTASVTGKGRTNHGQFTFRAEGRQYHVKPHRFAWHLLRGPIPVGVQVNHRCDVPRCCNPAHLYLGTQADNVRDAVARGRYHVARTAIFSPADRLAIYLMPNKRGLSATLARRFGVSRAAISRIRRGRFIGAPLQFTPVPSVQVPVRGALHLGQVQPEAAPLQSQPLRGLFCESEAV